MTRKIVVVEDDQPILDLMEILLKKLGYEPVLIPNGLDALSAVKADPPALILLDIMMSPLSGWEFLERLRTEYNLREIPVLLFTASPNVPEKMRTLNDPLVGILQKPVTFNELRTAIEKFLG
ncbi:response regulator receiver protein [Methanoregula boonei 6A8]|jgi:CheY-like chemotaxis protein|uniref:Response regulator receiver protein n=1 Tax=Methanoregula boonei (strain DSM 21154 / JCM 14090 / 6A8) TaxID=456442 RepID=A7I7C7_METB6|nr:response regulator [Methanoregula boonei]ABS55638.1 response regulator receiver protein [Methanoregula boonei 6A8]